MQNTLLFMVFSDLPPLEHILLSYCKVFPVSCKDILVQGIMYHDLVGCLFLFALHLCGLDDKMQAVLWHEPMELCMQAHSEFSSIMQ